MDEEKAFTLLEVVDQLLRLSGRSGPTVLACERETLWKRVQQAAKSGQLQVRHPDNGLTENFNDWPAPSSSALVSTVTDVNSWLAADGAPYRVAPLSPRHPLQLDQAAEFIAQHRRSAVTARDLLDAATQGRVRIHAEIRTSRPLKLKAAREGVSLPTSGDGLPPGFVENEVMLPLPVEACRRLASSGRANWRYLEESVRIPEDDPFGLGGELHRVKRWELEDGEPDFETVLADCRIAWWDVQALAEGRLQSAPGYIAEEPPRTQAMEAERGVSLDPSLLATRKQLIDAFGVFTGMNHGWFKNLTDVPALLKARRIKGSGGRGHLQEPLFCPVDVMRWLISDTRKKGSKLGEDKAWELLEKNFPKAYSAHSAADSRET